MQFRSVSLLIVLAAAGCAQQPIKPPQIVRVTVPVPVKVDPTLTTPCPIAMPKNRTVAEAVRIARERRASLETCNAQLDAIRDTH